VGPIIISINFGAYPRSGNTFTNSSMSNGLINVDYCVHEHNAHKLLNTLNRFTIIRNPLDAISSAIVHYSSTHDDRVNRFVEWYVDYYNQCLNKSCLFVDFNNLIFNPRKVFISLLDKFQIKEHNFYFLDFSLSDKNATEPDKQYEVFKIKDEILYSQYYASAVQIYEKILSESRPQFENVTADTASIIL